MLGFCLEVGPSIPARPRPAKDGQPYLEMSPANYPVSGFPLRFRCLCFLPAATWGCTCHPEKFTLSRIRGQAVTGRDLLLELCYDGF
jgi:hypothetical protein